MFSPAIHIRMYAGQLRSTMRSGFEFPQKTDHVTIREDQVREVQHDDGISRFCGERPAQLAPAEGRLRR
jgi:hypothetical protein